MQKILLIEDNPFIRENISLMLEFANYEVVVAENGMAGFEAALKELPDLILCDIMMPKTNGYVVLSALRSYPETAPIPFIFLSAKSSNECILEGLAMGADDYLIKPFHEQELLIAIENGLNRNANMQR